MQNLTAKLKRIKVDSLYSKKKHFNAADRLEAKHYRVGIPLIILNILTSSILFYVLTDGATNSIKYVPLVFSLIAALLSGFQTYFNWPQKVEGHRRVGNKYLSVMKKCDRLQGYIADGLLTDEQIINRIEKIAEEADKANVESEAFPTSILDYQLAKKGIESGEEDYTETELEL